MFDYYSPTDFKFVYVDLDDRRDRDRPLVRKQRWVTDASFSRALTPGVDQKLTLQLGANTVTVCVNGGVAGAFTYNGPVVDGGLGAFEPDAARRRSTTCAGMIGTHVVNEVDKTPPT